MTHRHGPLPLKVECAWRRLTATLVDTCDAVLAVILAPSCAACGLPLDRLIAGPVCQACWQAVRRLAPPFCDQCGESLSTWRIVDASTNRCARCRRAQRPVVRGRALGPYEGALRSILHALKYDGRRSLGRQLSAQMRAHLRDVLEGVDAVVPVPLHRSRMRERGFNQAVDLASELGPPVQHLLVRVRATPPQAGLPEARRHHNVRGAFEATRRSARWQGAVVAVVDDVSTTGATLDACADALLAAGIGEVRAVTAARAVRRQPR